MSPIFGSATGSSIKFQSIGSEFTGTISGEPSLEQMTEFGSNGKTKLSWPDGNPKLQAIVPFIDEDGNARKLYAPKHADLFKKLNSAVASTPGLPDLIEGTKLHIKYTHNGVGKGSVPPKMYSVDVLDFPGTAAPAAAAAAAPKPAAKPVDLWSNDEDDF